ncbi:MAG: polysaccharide deacetylase family protein [Pseudomonadota bacterium]
MKNPIRLFSFLIFLVFLHSNCFAAATAKNFKWPKGVKTAVSLAYDDSLNSQLDHAIPALNKYQFKGSFYLILSSDVLLNRLPEWRAAAANGHELANHTLFHQCSRSLPNRDWVVAHRDLDKVSAAQLKDQIMAGNIMLHAIDGKTERTFTTPCGDLNAGGENYVNTIKSEFVAIKSIIGTGVTSDMNQLDPYAVNFATPADVTGQQLIGIVKKAAKKGSMINFTFHGIGGDHLSITKEAHDELLQYLAQNSDIYWVDTFINIMKYVKENQKK